MEQLRSEMTTNPPLPGSYSPKRGDLCAAKYTDDEWYRAKIERINKDNTVNILYIDYGNVREPDDLSAVNGRLPFVPKITAKLHGVLWRCRHTK